MTLRVGAAKLWAAWRSRCLDIWIAATLSQLAHITRRPKMETKLLELRDNGTRIQAMAIRLDSANERERSDHRTYILLAEIDGGGGRINCDPFEWGNERTKHAAHMELLENWDGYKRSEE